jgi:hypothetical protein
LSDPAQNPDEIVLVNFTSYDPGTPSQPRNDPACLVNRGDHPYLRHLSCINYRDALFLSSAQIEQLDAGNLIVWHTMDVNPGLLARIRAGAFTSRHRPGRLIRILKAQGVVPPINP